MSQNADIKIRALPRGTDKSERKKDSGKPNKKAGNSPRWIIYVGIISCLLMVAVLLYPGQDRLHVKKPSVAKHRVPQTQDLASVGGRMNDVVGKYMQEASIKREVMQQQRQLENMNVARLDMNSGNYMAGGEEKRGDFGVQLDQENSAEEVYRDINGTGSGYADVAPHDRINNRLANRRWMNEMERAERINFVRNFLKSAYDRGYEVQLDQNLVVVGVRRINRMQKINIDQIIDRMAKQGL